MLVCLCVCVGPVLTALHGHSESGCLFLVSCSLIPFPFPFLFLIPWSSLGPGRAFFRFAIVVASVPGASSTSSPPLLQGSAASHPTVSALAISSQTQSDPQSQSPPPRPQILLRTRLLLNFLTHGLELTYPAHVPRSSIPNSTCSSCRSPTVKHQPQPAQSLNNIPSHQRLSSPVIFTVFSRSCVSNIQD